MYLTPTTQSEQISNFSEKIANELQTIRQNIDDIDGGSITDATTFGNQNNSVMSDFSEYVEKINVIKSHRSTLEELDERLQDFENVINETIED